MKRGPDTSIDTGFAEKPKNWLGRLAIMAVLAGGANACASEQRPAVDSTNKAPETCTDRTITWHETNDPNTSMYEICGQKYLVRYEGHPASTNVKYSSIPVTGRTESKGTSVDYETSELGSRTETTPVVVETEKAAPPEEEK